MERCREGPHRAPAEDAAFIADTGHDADRIRANVRNLRMKPVIHSNPSRKRALPLDRPLYRLRYRVECFFHDLKHFRAVATLHDKTATSYLAVLHVASMLLWLRSSGTAPSLSPPAAR
ncbi:transposase [Myxococcus sp. MxC21-1]|uniref:transposase n=1 Tax=Myxococcus sp. MxC21-1 TaxID=3041439 RepID=UPI00397762AA